MQCFGFRCDRATNQGNEHTLNLRRFTMARVVIACPVEKVREDHPEADIDPLKTMLNDS